MLRAVLFASAALVALPAIGADDAALIALFTGPGLLASSDTATSDVDSSVPPVDEGFDQSVTPNDGTVATLPTVHAHYEITWEEDPALEGITEVDGVPVIHLDDWHGQGAITEEAQFVSLTGKAFIDGGGHYYAVEGDVAEPPQQSRSSM